MGFGGGAFLAGYLNVYLMDHMGVARAIIGTAAPILAARAGLEALPSSER